MFFLKNYKAKTIPNRDSQQVKYINDFRIATDGDDFEKIGWRLFVEKKFPNYDIFWANFIAPNTRRPIDIWFKDNTPDDVRILSMLHYGIFTHFYYIYSNLHSMNDIEIFRHSYIKLASIIDLAEEFLVKFLIHLKKINVERLVDEYENKNFTLTREEIKKQFIKTNNITKPILSRIELIKKFYNSVPFEKYSTGIKSYRNILIHSWPLFQIQPNKVPKKATVLNINYRDWTKIVNKLNNLHERDRLLNADFIGMHELIREDSDTIIKLLNELWESVLFDLNHHCAQV